MDKKLKINSYLVEQDMDVQEHLLKYLESGMIWMQKYIDKGKSLQDFLVDTKEVYWVVKEKMMEKAVNDMNIGSKPD